MGGDFDEKLLKKYKPDDRSGLIDSMMEIQEKYGYLSEEAISEISKHFNLASSKVYGIASFYNNIKFRPVGKYHIKICNGTVCHLNDSGLLLRELEKELKINVGQTSRDGRFSLEQVSCLGSCGLSPVLMINGHTFTNVKISEIRDIIDSFKNQ